MGTTINIDHQGKRFAIDVKEVSLRLCCDCDCDCDRNCDRGCAGTVP